MNFDAAIVITHKLHVELSKGETNSKSEYVEIEVSLSSRIELTIPASMCINILFL